MTATITRIENGKVYAKSVNPLGEKPEPHHYNVPLGHMASITSKWQVDYNKWQQAESERQELLLYEDDYLIFDNEDFSGEIYYYRKSLDDIPKRIRISDSIEVTREGNYFKIK